MDAVFLKLLNMSITASWLILAVVVLRLLLKKAPKWVSCALWVLVGLRLVLPFSFESVFSLIPSAQTVSPDIIYSQTPGITSGIPAINDALNPIISGSFAPIPEASANPLQIWTAVASYVWLIGIAAMLLYAATSYLRLRRRVKASIHVRDNLWICDDIKTPFILGIFKPRIYLPSGMGEATEAHVVAHENAHLKRRDHLWKPLGFLLLAVYWFNPLCWLAYILLCRDIELACDEKVIRGMEKGDVLAYSEALLSCSVPRRMVMACPLAFGEVGVKERIKTVLNYKKPAFWVIVAAVTACIVVAVCFLTNPKESRVFPMKVKNLSDLNPQYITDSIASIVGTNDGSELNVNADQFSLELSSDFTFDDINVIRFFYTQNRDTVSAQLSFSLDGESSYVTESTDWPEQNRVFKLLHYLEALEYLPQEQIRQLSPTADRYMVEFRDDGSPDDFERTITYTSQGVDAVDGWYIHLELQPLHAVDGAYQGTSGEVIQLFYGSTDYAAMLSLNDVPTLSKKGENLTWSDFDGYVYTETGSGLYIRVYEIDEQFSLMIGGGSTDEAPMYIRLVSNADQDDYIDIRTENVENFIAEHGGSVSTVGSADSPERVTQTADPLDAAVSAAILAHNQNGYQESNFACESHVTLATVSATPTVGQNTHEITVYTMTLYQEYELTVAGIKELWGGHVPTALTFKLSEDGTYTLTEYWEPRDGSYYAPDIRDKFPADIAENALDTQKYILEQMQNCYAQAVEYGKIDTNAVVEQLLEIIISSPTSSSNPGDYIDAHPIEYRELTYYGDYTLKYVFGEYLKGGQTDLRGWIMMYACMDVISSTGEANHPLENVVLTGQDWFDGFRSYADVLSRNNSAEDMQKFYPASWLLLQMIG